MHIVVCDDEEYTRFYLRSLIEKKADCRVAELSSGKELLEYVSEGRNPAIDILFLDIAMDDIDGMEAAKALRRAQAESKKAVWGSLPLIIFVTGYSNLMPEAFGVNAFGFVVKPVDEAEFEALLERALEESRHILERSSGKPKIFEIRSSSSRQMIPVDEILFIESTGHKVQIYMENGIAEYSANIGDMERDLGPQFFRVHKGYLVNMAKISRFDRTKACLKSGAQVPVSKYRYRDFADAYMAMISNEYAAVGETVG